MVDIVSGRNHLLTSTRYKDRLMYSVSFAEVAWCSCNFTHQVLVNTFQFRYTVSNRHCVGCDIYLSKVSCLHRSSRKSCYHFLHYVTIYSHYLLRLQSIQFCWRTQLQGGVDVKDSAKNKNMWATKKPSYFPLYWLVYRDPYIGLLKSPYNWVVYGSIIPYTT